MRAGRFLSFIAAAGAGVFGAWLMGMFETGEPAGEVSGRDNLLSLAGFFIFLGGLVAGVFLLRHLLPPITRGEMVAWGPVRERGRSRFIRAGVVRGLSTGLLALAGIVALNYLQGEPLGSRFGAREVALYASLLLVVLIGAWYDAVRVWEVNEAAYDKLIGGAPAAGGPPEPAGR